MPKPHGVILQQPDLSGTPSGNPPAGSLLLYFKNGVLHQKTSAGVESQVASGGGGSAVAPVQTDAPSSPTTGQMWYDSDEVSAPRPGVDAPFKVDAVTRVQTTLSGTGEFVDQAPAGLGRIILVRAQTNPEENGVYVVQTGAWTRHPSFPTGDEPGLVRAGGIGVELAGTLWASTPPRTAGQHVRWEQLDYPGADYATTTPEAPLSGMRVFTRHRARRMLSVIGPSGQDTQLQPALFSNRVARLTVINNVAPPLFDGLAVTNRATAPAAVPVATTNFYTSMVRARYASTATAGNAGGFRSTTAQWFASSTPNMGGLFMVCRLGLNAISATNRLFIGFSTATADLAAGSDPTTYTNCFGFAANAAHTQLRFIHNDGTGTATDAGALGAAFSTQTAATNFWELRIFIPSGAGNVVYWSAHRLNDGTVVQGGPITTDLPAVGSLLAFHAMHSNGTTAAAVSMDVQSLYIETDN